jgi:TonB family protein
MTGGRLRERPSTRSAVRPPKPWQKDRIGGEPFLKKRTSMNRRTFFLFVVAAAIGLAGCFIWAVFLTPAFEPLFDRGLRVLTQGSKRILGWEKNETPPEEKRIREEVILKKMEEAGNQHDWRTLAAEYPRPKKKESLSEKEKLKLLQESPEFKTMEKEMNAFLRKKEELFQPDLPSPSMREPSDITAQQDRGVEKVMEKLSGSKEKSNQDKPLEENLSLGIKGPLVSRRILERPNPPQAKVRVEAEIELTVFVTAGGMVERVIPSVKGDAELERIAIHYLKQWRFAPLPKEQGQVEQWGTLPIKFKLQ